MQRGELQRFAVADRLTVGVVLPGGDVGEVHVVPSGFALVTLLSSFAAREEECQTIRMYSFDPNWKFTHRILVKKCA